MWRYAEYVCTLLPGNPIRVKAFSTLEILKNIEQPDRVIVFASDGLAAELKAEWGSYRELENSARNFAEEYLCGEGVEVIILPGIFRKSARDELAFTVDLRAYRLLCLYWIYRRALELASEHGEGLYIAVDISHGINYMPVLAFDAAQEAAAMCSVALAKPIELRVYQADPYPQLTPEIDQKLRRSRENLCEPQDKSVDPPKIRYNLLRSVKVHPWELAKYAAYHGEGTKKLLTDPRGIPDSENVGKLLNESALP